MRPLKGAVTWVKPRSSSAVRELCLSEPTRASAPWRSGYPVVEAVALRGGTWLRAPAARARPSSSPRPAESRLSYCRTVGPDAALPPASKGGSITKRSWPCLDDLAVREVDLVEIARDAGPASRPPSTGSNRPVNSSHSVIRRTRGLATVTVGGIAALRLGGTLVAAVVASGKGQQPNDTDQAAPPRRRLCTRMSPHRPLADPVPCRPRPRRPPTTHRCAEVSENLSIPQDGVHRERQPAQPGLMPASTTRRSTVP